MGDSLPSVALGSRWTVVGVAAGSDHTCARLEDGVARAVKCWGGNFDGELGLGDIAKRGYEQGPGDPGNHRGDEGGEMGDSLPSVQLGTNRSAVTLALGGWFSCALLDDASVKCWGSNSYGQLGLGNASDRGGAGGEMGDSLPAVDLGRAVVQLVVGWRHACALLDDGQLCAPHPISLTWVGCVSFS